MLAHARASTEADDADLFRRIAAAIAAERVITLRVEAFDWNCPQHITPRFTEAEVRAATEPHRERRDALERENAALRARLRGSLVDP